MERGGQEDFREKTERTPSVGGGCGVLPTVAVDILQHFALFLLLL